MEFDEKVKQLYYQMQVAQKQMKSLQEQYDGLSNKEMEIHYIKQSLNDLSELDGEKEILVPINNGIFIKAMVKKTDKLLVNVGSDIVVSKGVDKTQEMMDVQLKEVKKYQAHLQSDIQVTSERLQKMEKQFEEIQKGM